MRLSTLGVLVLLLSVTPRAEAQPRPWATTVPVPAVPSGARIDVHDDAHLSGLPTASARQLHAQLRRSVVRGVPEVARWITERVGPMPTPSPPGDLSILLLTQPQEYVERSLLIVRFVAVEPTGSVVVQRPEGFEPTALDAWAEGLLGALRLPAPRRAPRTPPPPHLTITIQVVWREPAGLREERLRGRILFSPFQRVSGPEVDLEQLQRATQRYAGAIRACYERALRTNPEVRGRQRFELTVEPDGRVRDVRLPQGPFHAEVAACAAGRLQRARFPVQDEALVFAFEVLFAPQN